MATKWTLWFLCGNDFLGRSRTFHAFKTFLNGLIRLIKWLTINCQSRVWQIYS